MLRNFVYLDDEQLDQYIAQVEDGLRQIRRRTANAEASKSGGADVKVVKGQAARSEGMSETEEFSDSAPARFSRLLQLVRGHEEDFDWVEALQDADLEAVRPGFMVDVAADLYESDVTKVTGPNGMMGMLPLMAKMQSAFGSWKTASENLPDAKALEAMAAFGAAMPELILLGDVADSDWRVVCVLPGTTGVEGDARVVGKVKRVIRSGNHEPLPGVPFLEQMPRPQRREFVRKGPQAGQEMLWVEGPALILDTLAIWR